MALTMKETTHDEEVRLVERYMVVPETRTPRHDLFLSSLDLFWRHFDHVRMLHFYATQEQDAFITALRHSLARVLVPFYPAAGRLALSGQQLQQCRKEEYYGPRLCIDCNDAGVEFTIAVADTVDFLALKAQNFQPHPLFRKLAPYNSDRVQPSSDCIFALRPLLAIQATKLSSGRGVVVGVAHSHVLADAESWCHFMRSWAQCARKVPIDMPPLHMRQALAVETPLREKASLPHYPAVQSSQPASADPLTEMYLFQSDEGLQELKQAASADTESVSVKGDNDQDHRPDQFSSYETMCAYWWKEITRARQLDGDTVLRFHVFSNMRARLTPKLPPAYFGNARADEILHESLGSTAARIRQASLACSPEAMWSTIHWLELHGQAYDVEYLQQNNMPCVRTVCSPRFQFYDVDYGYGRPVAVRPPKVNGEGDMMLYPPRDGGGVDIFLGSSPDAAKRLLSSISSKLPGFSKM